MSVSPRGNRWQAAASYKGRRVRADFSSREEAEGWHADALAALINGREPPAPREGAKVSPQSAGMTLRDALELTERTRWREAKSKDNLVILGTIVCRAFGPSRLVQSIKTTDILEWGSRLDKAGKSGATINRHMSALGAIMRTVAEAGGYEWTPPRFPSRRKESEGRTGVLTGEQVAAIEAALRTYGQPDEGDLVRLLFETGMRLGEAERLRWMDIVMPATGPAFARLVQGTKNAEARDVPLTSPVRAILTRRKAEHDASEMCWDQRKGARVFPALNTWGARRAFQKALKLLRLEGDDICLHTLRHSCGTALLQRGVDSRYVRRILGHKTTLMTDRYTRVLPADLAAVVAKMEAA